MDMEFMTTMIIGTQIHSSGTMVGATAGLGDLGVAGMAQCGDGIILTAGNTGAGVAAGATRMDMSVVARLVSQDIELLRALKVCAMTALV